MEKSTERPTENEDKNLEWAIDTLPNRLTFFRLFLIPMILGALFMIKLEPMEGDSKAASVLGYIAAWSFVVAGITDFLDGFIARKRQTITAFGSFLDPIADKFLVISSLIMLASLERVHVLVTILLVLREVYIVSLRLLARERGMKVPVGQSGKWKTALQMIAIPLLMAADTFEGISTLFVGRLLIYGTTILSLYSAFCYSLDLVRRIKAKRGIPS